VTEGISRDRQELELQMALSESSFVAIGLRAFEREPALVRARELSERLGDNVRLMEAQLALAHLRFNQRDFGAARELAERVLVMSEEASAPVILAGTHSVLGLVRFATGDFAATRQHFERAVELFATTSPREGGGLFAQIAPNVLLAVVIFLGYPAKALSRAREQLAAARRSTDPFSLVFALFGDGLKSCLASRHPYGRYGDTASRRGAFHRDRACNPSFFNLSRFFARLGHGYCWGVPRRESPRCAEAYRIP